MLLTLANVAPAFGADDRYLRARFDELIFRDNEQHASLPLFKTLFGLTRWPELAAEECARLNRW